ncbi:unnamed protein product [Albugo candida]|uniref:Uncharacterized protein n=1 Tax=Albugo candida TaxID=65357 RepID=A0A024G3Q3_9STRA|nr:unnamed protein product [Albugo candida]|eukprot:CCI41207.1 unnamed protein product [Albugo candida]
MATKYLENVSVLNQLVMLSGMRVLAYWRSGAISFSTLRRTNRNRMGRGVLLINSTISSYVAVLCPLIATIKLPTDTSRISASPPLVTLLTSAKPPFVFANVNPRACPCKPNSRSYFFHS